MDGVGSLPECAFRNCEKLANINVGSCAQVGNQCFENCRSLTHISLESCTAIGYEGFVNCSALVSVVCKAKVAIERSAFMNCICLETPPERAVSIGDFAFANCKALKECNWSTVTSLGATSSYSTSIVLPG